MSKAISDPQKLRAIIDAKDREIADLEVKLRIAQLDDLTGLPKRSQLIEEAQHLLNKKQLPTSLIFMDLNGFKKINDEIGHQSGNSLLIQFSEFLKRQKELLGEGGLLITLSRLGGDEFAILMPYMEEEEASEFMKLIKKNLRSEVFEIGEGQTFAIHVAMGVGTAGLDCTMTSTLMHRADKAMYEDKARMRGAGEVTKKVE